MYLRRCHRTKDGNASRVWGLVESYRTVRGLRQRVAAWLGAMDEQGRLGVRYCAERKATHQSSLFQQTKPEWVEVDLKRVRVERSRRFGVPGWGWS